MNQLKKFLSGISKSIYLDNNNIFQRTKKYMNASDVNSAWNKAIEEEIKITKEDKEILKMFGKLLGKTDKKGQISEIDLSLNFIENQIQHAEFEKNKSTKLYKSLGVFVGIGITIIIW